VVTKHHHSLKVSLHYLVKYKSVKSVNIFGEEFAANFFIPSCTTVDSIVFL